MGAKALIEAALAAADAYEQARINMRAAGQALSQATADLDAANKSLHDELDANGPRLYIDETTEPPTYYVYKAAEPDTYTASEIEVAA